MLLSVLHSVFKWTEIISIVVFLIQYWLLKKSYIFSDKSIAKISEKYVGKHIISESVHANKGQVGVYIYPNRPGLFFLQFNFTLSYFQF